MPPWQERLSRGLRIARRPPVVAAGLLATLLVGLGWGLGDGPVRVVSDARVDQPVPAVSGELVTTGVATAAVPSEPGTSRIGPDWSDENARGTGGPGQGRPLAAFAIPFDRDDSRPWVAIIVTDLGLQEDATSGALALPGSVGLLFSPYAPDLAEQVAAARAQGHEILLGLPMEPPNFPNDDPGPHTLLAEASTAVNLERLAWVMSQTQGYIALAGPAGRFASSAAAGPVAREIAESGLGLVELGGRGLSEAARAVGVPYAGAGPPIDAEPTGLAIDYALAALEADALEKGYALGVAQPYPVTLERLAVWARGLADKGLVLAPVSALLKEQAGRVSRPPGEGGPGHAGYG